MNTGTSVRFMCGNSSATLARRTFKAREFITVRLCTKWNGIEYDRRPIWPWMPVDGDFPCSVSARTLYRIAEEIFDETGDTIWKRANVDQGVTP